MCKLVWNAKDLNQTRTFADSLVQVIREQFCRLNCLVVTLDGPLGAGKTTLTSLLCQGLGVDQGDISSPTFSLQNIYTADMGGATKPEKNATKINHFDLYRIRDEDELLETGIEETLESAGIHLIEWSNRFPEVVPIQALKIEIRSLGGQARDFEVSGCDDEFLQALQHRLDQHSQPKQ